MINISRNNHGSVIPLMLFILTIITAGALYSLLFIKVGFETFSSYIPDGQYKTIILLMFRAIPGIILITGVVALLITGLKRRGPAG